MREKIRKAIQHLLSAAELWEVTTATGNSFHNLFLKTVFRILFKIWLWIYGFIIFTKYKATSLLCSWLQIKCFSSPEMSHFKKKLLQTRGTLFHLILLPPRTLEKSCLCPEPLLGFSPSAIKSSTTFLWFLACLCSVSRERKGHYFPFYRPPLPASAPPATCGTMALFIAWA